MSAPGKFPLLPRKNNTDKSDYGHLLILAGSRAMPGAAILAALGALRSGAGLVTLAYPRGITKSLFRQFVPELILLPLEDTARGSLSAKASQGLFDYIKRRRINALVAGPGLTTHPECAALVRALVQKAPAPLVLDADGLNAFADKGRLLKNDRAALVFTPHRREFLRVFGVPVPEDQRLKAELAKKIASLYHGVLILKGHRTIVAAHDRLFVNRTGNPAMAKGGSGDVLSGVIGAFLAQGLGPFEAARWAVYFHGRAGDLAARQKSQLGVLARDIAENLPRVFLE